MSLPNHIIKQIQQHYQASNWCLITLNQNNQIIKLNSKASSELNIHSKQQNIQDALPLLATEPLDESFFLPYYNHNEHVFDVHFIVDSSHKFVIMVPVDILHQQVQYKQQLAHDEEIEKLRFKALFNALELAQEELIRANQAKSFYISALSHEMGNPLNAIKGYNNLLQEQAIDLEQATAVIDKNVDKLNKIITQAIDYDNKKSHKNNFIFHPHQLIDELIKDFKIQAQQKSLTLINQVDKKLSVSSNQTKWQQILTNLISNAIKYTDQGSITIQSSINNEHLLVDVIDTGCGISSEFQPDLFTAWARENKSIAKGNGIGLVISKMMAEQLSADLFLLATNTTGSTFRFQFPKEKVVTVKHILLVDDDEDCLALFEYFLTQAQHQVTTANSIDTLAEQLSHKYFDAIITDLNLGKAQVTDVFHLLKDTKLKIVVTANPTAELTEKLYQYGFDLVLAKPLNQLDLVNSVA
ncbi:ATP-binding response regulator [Marinicella litoralis]|uniref:histidine kinase n=1 Tax=Marinicella litoralis TaxID=644220 RepID=A0A4R6XXJ9_9GAMM|nr:hybrid sensor histidine kinase/response regulator [Marinicella litoralis]TDR23329.1 signal transduction histidine kinase [Marinicella litoralis]